MKIKQLKIQQKGPYLKKILKINKYKYKIKYKFKINNKNKKKTEK